MKNFEKADIISKVAFNKNKARFLPRTEQMKLNAAMKNKLLRFASEIAAEKERPQTMKLIDEMMNGMHGQRVKDLYNYRREGNHVMALLCNSIPPEVVYGLGNFVPVSVCMGAGEVEPYADEYTKGMCSVTRSMIGFLKTGMCVFFNLADHVLASDMCPTVKKAADIIPQISDEFELYCLETNEKDGKLNVDVNGLKKWVAKITGSKGFDNKRLLKYARLFSDIRHEYKAIFSLRRHSNPPLNGKNGLWIQQLALVEEPEKLLHVLKKLRRELEENVKNNKGYNPNGTKKRVMLISPRIMPPFGEIYRLIEKCNALIVCEEIDMGITNIDYDFDHFAGLLGENDAFPDKALKYILESIDITSTSCVEEFDFQKIMNKVNNYGVDAVIAFSFKNCPVMWQKTKKICNLLEESGIPSKTVQSGYMEIYEQEEIFVEEIHNFLSP